MSAQTVTVASNAGPYVTVPASTFTDSVFVDLLVTVTDGDRYGRGLVASIDDEHVTLFVVWENPA